MGTPQIPSVDSDSKLFPSAVMRAVAPQAHAGAIKEAVITDQQFAGGADPTGQIPADDAIQAAWDAGYTTIFFPPGQNQPGQYAITRKIDLTGADTYSDRSLRGLRREGPRSSTLVWAGPAGGTVVGTAALDNSSPQKHYRGSVKNLSISYPNSLRTGTSVGLYVARPTGGEIKGVRVYGSGDSNDSSLYPIQQGSVGIYIDGAQNNGPFTVQSCAVGHHWDAGYKITASHVSLLGSSAYYVNNAAVIDQDSINSGSGPAYNILIDGLHAYYPITSWLRLTRATSVVTQAGFCEPDPAGAPVSAIYADASFTGWAAIRALYRTRGTVIKHFGTGRVVYENVQDQTRASYVGNASTGTPTSPDQLTSMVRQHFGYGDYKTTSTTDARAAIASSSTPLFPGASGGFRYRFVARISNDTAGCGYKVTVNQSSSSVAVGAVVPGNGLFQPKIKTAVTSAGVSEDVVIDAAVNGQSGGYYFTAAVTAIGGGTVTVTDGFLVIEAY